jgi:type VI secretion system protein VasD
VLKEITPGESRSEVIGLPPEVKFIGLMAEFIQYRNADAIMVFPIVEHNQNIFDIAIDSNKLSVYQEPENNDLHEASRPVRSDRIH